MTRKNRTKFANNVLTFFTFSTGAIPSVSKLSPGQAAYHFLAGYHDGKFVPAYSRAPSPADPLALASSLFSHVGGSISLFFLSGYLVTRVSSLPFAHYCLSGIGSED
jgi:hypothetical protein